jgi:nucleotide-binding universal stress UspA family protein
MKIVVGYVEAPESKAALERAVAEAQAHSGELHVVRILVLRADETPDEARELAEAGAADREDLERLADRLRADGIATHPHVATTTQQPSEALLDIAREQQADMIVLGLRRRSRVGKVLFGSTLQEVLLEAECPVLAVKADSS